MAAATGVRGRCELPPCSGPGWLLSLSALLSMAARGAFATTHWVVTEDGKIQQQVEARESLPAGACPHSWGRFPGPTPDYLAPRGPAPSLPSPCPCAPTWVTLAPSLPHLCPGPPLGVCKFSGFQPWGRAPPGESRRVWGVGPWGHNLVLGLSKRSFRYLSLPRFPRGPRVVSFPRGSRKAGGSAGMCASPRVVTASASQALGHLMLPSPTSSLTCWNSCQAVVVSACTVTQVNRGSLGTTHTPLPKECSKMPLVALPASFQL